MRFDYGSAFHRLAVLKAHDQYGHSRVPDTKHATMPCMLPMTSAFDGAGSLQKGRKLGNGSGTDSMDVQLSTQ